MFALLLTLGCSAGPDAAPAPLAPPPAPAPAPAAASTRVVFLGDSLTAGMGLAADQAFPALLQDTWTAAGLSVEVVNAGVSGDTTAGGVRRIDWVLSQKPDLVVVELGANDMLRGLPVAEVEANLRTILTKTRDAGAAAVLLGMRADPSLGPDYGAAFDAVYPKLATEFSAPLVPFFLDGVAGVPALNQADGIHPTAEGHAKIAAAIEPTLRPALAAPAAP